MPISSLYPEVVEYPGIIAAKRDGTDFRGTSSVPETAPPPYFGLQAPSFEE